MTAPETAPEPETAPAPEPEPEPQTATEAAQDALARELALLRQASGAMRAADPAAALTAVDQHAADFPAGQLAEEAAVVRIEALCALGRNDDAGAARRAFRARWPRSAQRDRAARPCSTQGGPR